MSSYSEILKLNVESLHSLGDAYFGYAQSLIKREDPKLYSYIASCYTLSAVMKSIIEPGSGSEAFRKAAQYYRREKNNYWLICSICAYDTESLSAAVYNYEFDKQSNSFEEYLVSTLIGDSIFQDFNFLSQYGTIGRLNIPIKSYLDAIREVLAINKIDKDRSFRNIQSFLERSSERIYALMEDTFHWQELLGNFVPIEPETLALCIVLCKKLEDVNGTVKGVLSQSELNLIEKLPLQLADEIYKIQSKSS